MTHWSQKDAEKTDVLLLRALMSQYTRQTYVSAQLPSALGWGLRMCCWRRKQQEHPAFPIGENGN